MSKPRDDAQQALAAAIAGVAALLPDEVGKALAPPSTAEGAGATADPAPTTVRPEDEVNKAQCPKCGAACSEAARSCGKCGAAIEVGKAAGERQAGEPEDVRVTEVNGEALKAIFREAVREVVLKEVPGLVRDEVGKALEAGVNPRLDGITRGVTASLVADKEVAKALQLAQRTPAATPPAPGVAVSSRRPVVNPAEVRSASELPTADAGQRWSEGEVQKAIGEQVLHPNVGVFYVNNGGRWPQDCDAEALDAAVRQANGR